MAQSWTCPHCSRPTTITSEDVSFESHQLDIEKKEGRRVLHTTFTVCPNPECERITLMASLYSGAFKPGQGTVRTKIIRSWLLVPASTAKNFPVYVPQAVRDDYEEACASAEPSPKASATLARRCLQGMIRDFWGVSKSRLIDEIVAIEERVDPDVWAAIDAVRQVGNIGAHMERDVNEIIDVESDEAKQLLGLIEMLVEEWYIARDDRQKKLQAIKALADAKKPPKAAGGN